jgi:hypothetical protein
MLSFSKVKRRLLVPPIEPGEGVAPSTMNTRGSRDR